MQNGKSRIKRVASAIIAGVMALQTVAPVISYADDTASSVATTDDSDAIANVDPGTPVQVDATASEEPSDAPSSGASQADENSEETETNNDSWKHVFENIIVFNGDGKVSYTITQDAVNGYTTEIKASDDGNTIEIINTHISVVPPKEEPKKEEPATPAPVVEVKVEQPAPTVTLIQTTNKPTGISFFESLFAK